jgi:UDP-glucose 4-epimerase
MELQNTLRAGYIGSHMVYALLDCGEKVVVIDDLSTGIRELVSDEACFIEGDVGDRALVCKTLHEHAVDAVIHFAGSVIVPESVENPIRYYENNTDASLSLVKSCVEEGVENFVFSSTAAVYGAVNQPKVTENSEKIPINPYGRSKLMTEWLLADVAAAHSIRYTALRYFNVAGADPLGRTGQSTPNATHLIKRACQASLGKVSHLDIYGTDFPTPDGTGVRDYIHVVDLADAHILALRALRAGAKSSIYNCGYGRGLSVREIIRAVEKASGKTLAVKEMARRAGDPAMMVADASRLQSALNWTPCLADIDIIVHSALAWESKLVGNNSGAA